MTLEQWDELLATHRILHISEQKFLSVKTFTFYTCILNWKSSNDMRVEHLLRQMTDKTIERTWLLTLRPWISKQFLLLLPKSFILEQNMVKLLSQTMIWYASKCLDSWLLCLQVEYLSKLINTNSIPWSRGNNLDQNATSKLKY